jgi:ABC-type phosphate transport system permease subunit
MPDEARASNGYPTATGLGSGDWPRQLVRPIPSTEGQDTIEYALLLTFIAVAAMVLLPTIASIVESIFSRVPVSPGG